MRRLLSFLTSPAVQDLVRRGHLKNDERRPLREARRLDQGDFQLIRDLGLHSDGLGREGRVVQTCVEIKFRTPDAIDAMLSS